MNRYSLLLATLLPLSAMAQADIADARTFAINSSVTVTGVVTSGDEFGGVRYVQDASAGIAAFPGTGSQAGFAPAIGDNITVTGTLKIYNGLLEIDPIASFTINSTGNPLPAPLVVTPSQLTEALEGQLVVVDDAQFVSGGSTFTSTTWDFNASSENGLIFVRSSNPLIGTVIPSGVCSITGIVSQFTFSVPPIDGYQLLPRGPYDIVLNSPINVTTAVTQQNITTSSFDLLWSTDVAGTNGVAYGLTPALGTVTNDAASATAHSVSLSSLAPATFYYAKVFSVLGPDTAWSTMGVYSTASLSSGTITVYFNQSVDNSVSAGTDAISLAGGAVNDTIAAYIDRANVTLDIAVYNTSDATIVNAVNAAVTRGVQVRWITEGTNANTGLTSLDASVPLLQRMNSLGSGMHNKFMIIDADVMDDAIVMGGSLNWTQDNLFDDYNDIVFVQDEALARAYRLEFEEMWGGTGPQPVPLNSKFGPDKTNNTPHEFIVGGSRVECYFSPSDNTTAEIVDAVNNTQHQIEFALLVLTENTIADALIDVNNGFTTGAEGMVEQVSGSGSDYAALVTAGVPMYSHEGIPGQLHHKYAIIDKGFPADDPLVITGSHNWSASANSDNDENTLILHSDAVADQFHQEFVKRRDQAIGIAELNGGLAALRAWPNPTTDHFFVDAALVTGGAVDLTLMDAAGRIVRTERVQGARGNNLFTVSTDDLPEGLYTLVLNSAGSRTQVRVIVAR